MRLPALLGPWLELYFAAVLFITNIRSINGISSPKKYFICLEPKLQICITWLTNSEEVLKFAGKDYYDIDVNRYCGLSDLVPIKPHRKFIKITSKGNNEKVFFCRLQNVIVDVVWIQNELKTLSRERRQAGHGLRGRYRGQTQSQYLAIDQGAGKDEGKAEAHSAADSSRASVSGSSGMGQAQSQTMYDPSCDDCVDHSGSTVEDLKRGPYISNKMGTPSDTSMHSSLPGGSLAFGQNLPPNIGYNQVRPGNYEVDQRGRSPSHGGFVPNNLALPGGSRGFSNDQTGVLPGTDLGSYDSNKGNLQGRNNYFPGKNGPSVFESATPGTFNSGSYSPNINPNSNTAFRPAYGTYGSDNFPSSMANKHMGNYIPNKQSTPGISGSIPTSSTGINGMTYFPSGPTEMSSSNYIPSQPPSNDVYGPGQNGVPVGADNYAQNLLNKSVPQRTSPSQTIPGSNDRLLPGSYPPTAGGSPGGISNTIYNPAQNNIPNHNNPDISLQKSLPGPVSGKGQYGSALPGGNGVYNGGTNWPIGTRSFQGPDGTTYYCCVAGPNNNPQFYKTGGESGEPTAFNIPAESLTGPNNLMAPPGTYNSGTGTGYGYPTPNTLLNPGIRGPANTGELLRYPGPSQQYAPENIINPNVFQGPKHTIVQTPTGNYSPSGSQERAQIPSEKYSPGSSGIRNTLQVPGGQQNLPGIGGQNIPGVSDGQYTPGAAGGQYIPRELGSENRFPVLGGQYSPGSTNGATVLPGQGGIPGQYLPGNIEGQFRFQGPVGQYGHGVPSDQIGLQSPGGQYNSGMPATQTGPQVSGTQYSPTGVGGQAGLQVPGVQYSEGLNTQNRQPDIGGQYALGGMGGQNIPQNPSGQFGSGTTANQNGLQGPGKQFNSEGPVNQNGIPNQVGQYSPGTITSGQYVPGASAQDGLQNFRTPYGFGGPGTQTNMQIPGGPYGYGSIGDQNAIQGPGGQYASIGNNGPSRIGGSGVPYNTDGTGEYYGSRGTIPQTGLNGPDALQGSRPTTDSRTPGDNFGSAGYANGPYGYDNQRNLIPSGNNNGAPKNVIDPKTVAIDGDDSEAEASVTQGGNGTVATASSKGGNEKGRAQTHVHGAYTGNGSFSAQAEISGENKAANSEVTGDKKGASSQAQGKGRNNKSQANVQLGSETGSVLTGSQSEGVMHSSNTQVQGSVKGGMADAQARGPGSTSSQAQIGFTPYKDDDKVNEQQAIPYVGGGTASAQSSGRTGSSQSQLRGSFKYGIAYNGAAQAGASLDKDVVFPNRLPFEKLDVYDESNININTNPETTLKPEDVMLTDKSVTHKYTFQENSTEMVTSTEIPFEPKLGPDEVEEEIEQQNPEYDYGSHTHSDHHKEISQASNSSHPPVEGRRSFQPNYNTNNADYDYGPEKDEHLSEDYDVDGYGTEGTEPIEMENYNELSKEPETHQNLHNPKRKGLEVRQTTGGNMQHIVLGALHDHDAEITQRNSERPDEKKIYQPGERVPGTGGYTIPIGFTGSVQSVASKDKTYVIGTDDSPSQAQTVSLTPGTGKVKYTYPATHTRNISPKNLRSLYNPKVDDDNRYISVSKSVTRDLDDENNIRKQYSHTYYTKSSSCGYFTFTCTMVSSAEGRKKVCKPKIPLNADGSPMRC